MLVFCYVAKVRSVAAVHIIRNEASMVPSTSGKLLLLACFFAVSYGKFAGSLCYLQKHAVGIFDGLISVSGDCSRPHAQQPSAVQGADEELDDYTAMRLQLGLSEEMFDCLVAAGHRLRQVQAQNRQAASQLSHVGGEEQDQVPDSMTALRRQLCMSEEEFAYVVDACNAVQRRQASNLQATSQPRQVSEAEENRVAADAALRHQLCLSEEEFAYVTAIFNGLPEIQKANCQAILATPR